MANRISLALTEREVASIRTPGYHTDGQGLALYVKAPKRTSPDKPGAKSWIFTYTFAGKRREMGLTIEQVKTQRVGRDI